MLAFEELLNVAESCDIMGVEGGYAGVIGALAKRGSTKALQGPWNGFPSTRRLSKHGKVHSQLGRA